MYVSTQLLIMVVVGKGILNYKYVKEILNNGEVIKHIHEQNNFTIKKLKILTCFSQFYSQH